MPLDASITESISPYPVNIPVFKAISYIFKNYVYDLKRFWFCPLGIRPKPYDPQYIDPQRFV